MPIDFTPGYKPKERKLSEREIAKLLSKLPAKRAGLTAFLLATGATYPSELADLRKGDVDKRRWMVRLRGTKRESRDRFVPIVEFARPWLTRSLEHMPFEPWTNIRRDLHRACDAIGIAHCSPNDLRRSVASLMRARGVEPQLIGAFLGHNDSRMAERVYGRITPEQLAHLLGQRLRSTARRHKAA
jgi:integrase